MQTNEIMEQIDNGFYKLPGTHRLNSQYRNGAGNHGHVIAAPVHPAIDHPLGQPQPELYTTNEQTPEQLIHENNLVASGRVFKPPQPSETAPCMDSEYNATKGAEVPIMHMGNLKMNSEVLNNDIPLEIPSVTPIGEIVQPQNDTSCDGNSTMQALTPFVPKSVSSQPKSTDFMPQSAPTRHEEDLMNEEKSQFSDLRAQGADEAVATDTTRAPQDDPSPKYNPSEPQIWVAAHASPPPLENSTRSFQDLMNTDKVDQSLGGCSDGMATTTQHQAMQNSEREEFPATIESLLKITTIDSPDQIALI